MSCSRNRMSLGKIFFYSTSGGGRRLTFTCNIYRWIKDVSSRASWVSTQGDICGWIKAYERKYENGEHENGNVLP